jgi:pseudouridine synthase
MLAKNRLNKQLVELGLSPSRRKADEAILGGKVMVNGKLATVGISVDSNDTITLDGKQGTTKNAIYVVFHKPAGYICSHAEQGSTKTIFTLLPKSFAGLKIAGRLDKESEGLVLLSSDGEFVHTITHPRAQKEKEYIVQTSQPLTTEQINTLRSGVRLHDGMSNFLSISKINPTTIRVVLSEGRNRQIRRTFEQLGLQVVRLQRVRIGNVKLNTLPVGKHIVITKDEVL